MIKSTKTKTLTLKIRAKCVYRKTLNTSLQSVSPVTLVVCFCVVFQSSCDLDQIVDTIEGQSLDSKSRIRQVLLYPCLKVIYNALITWFMKPKCKSTQNNHLKAEIYHRWLKYTGILKYKHCTNTIKPSAQQEQRWLHRESCAPYWIPGPQEPHRVPDPQDPHTLAHSF